MECLYCGGETTRKKVHYTIDRDAYHLHIRDVPANVCVQCGEKLFDEKEVEQIQEIVTSMDNKVKNVQTV